MLSRTEKLINYKGGLCLSILIPTRGHVSMRPFNRGIVKKNLSKAKALLTHNVEAGHQATSRMVRALDNVAAKLDSKKFDKGIGIFISPTLAELVYFPFAVEEQVIIGDSFESRDLLYYQEYNAPYFVVVLGKKKINVLKSGEGEVKEIVDRHFPMLYTDDREYAKPSRGNSFGERQKSFERDKSSLAKERMVTFFKEADHALDRFVKKPNLLILCGTKGETEQFLKITTHGELVAGTLPQSHRLFTQEMFNKFRQTIFKFNHTKQQILLKRLDEDYGNDQVAEGLENVWRAAQEGNGLLLAVEKDFRRKAYFQKSDRHRLHTFPPLGEFQIVADAVDDVIEMVREKNGQVVFVENKELERFSHIAMLLRHKKSQAVIGT